MYEDDPAHKIYVNESEMAALYESMDASGGRPLKLIYGALVVLVDDIHDLWVVDVLKGMRRHG